MSVRADILPGADGSRRLSYTRRCGWVDWGHARKGAAQRLKQLIEFETATLPMLRNLPVTLQGEPAYVLEFGEEMGRFHIVVSKVSHFVVRKGLPVLDKWPDPEPSADARGEVRPVPPPRSPNRPSPTTSQYHGGR